MVTNRQKVKFNKNSFENDAWQAKQVVVGIDEVGRGCLAGPLVTAAVILPIGKTSRLIADSKILTEEERLKAYAWITKNCWYATGILHNRAIDQHNIWQATLLAMKKALVHLLAISPYKEPKSILVDAMPLNLFDTSYKNIPVYYFPFGERKSTSIAAASIVAKVTRDRIMQLFEPIIPGYDLAQHKGYGTVLHKANIAALRHSIVHRMSFIDHLLNNQESDYDNQQTLC